MEVSNGLYLSPYAPAPTETWTIPQLERFTAEWERQARRQYTFTTVLPRRARIRLACKRHVDKAGIRLVRHGHYRAAVRLWRAFGMWRR